MSIDNSKLMYEPLKPWPTMTGDRLYVMQLVEQQAGRRSKAFVATIKDLLKVCGDDGPMQYVNILFDVEFAKDNPDAKPFDLLMDCPMFSVPALRAHFGDKDNG